MRGPDESSLSIMEIKYSNVVANTLIEEYESIFNDPRLGRPQHTQNQHLPLQHQQQRQMMQHLGYTSNIPAHANNNNHDDHFGLGLPSVPTYYHQSRHTNQQVPTINSLPYYPANSSLNSFQYYPVNTNQNSYQYYSLDSSELPYRSNKVITLYACVADTESELSFGPNEIIVDGEYKDGE